MLRSLSGLLLGAVFSLAALPAMAQDASTLAYWNFNDPVVVTTPTRGLSGTSIDFDPASGSELVSGTGQDFSAANSLNGDPAGAHLRVNNPIGSVLTYNVPTTGFTDLVFKYETRRSGSGAGTQHVSYSVDGTSFTPLTTVTVVDGAPEVVVLDFSDTDAVDDNPDFKVRIEFSAGAGGAAGNNRFDNVTVEGIDSNPPVFADIGLLFPRPEATHVSILPTLRWSGGTGPYTLQISASPDFDVLTVAQAGLADTTMTLVDQLATDTRYYWRVGVEEEGDVIFSLPGQFTTHAPHGHTALTHFSFHVADNPGRISETTVGDIYGDSAIVAVVPFGMDRDRLVAGFVGANADSVTVGEVRQESQWSSVDFTQPVVYTLYSGGTAVRQYEVTLVHSGLPVVYISTAGGAPILNKEDYVSSTVTIIEADGTVDIQASAGIRGRGNSTWSMPKKPYRIKLDTKASVLGNPADRDWVLLANYSDKTLMRTSVAFALGNEAGMEYTNRTRHVELMINGVYQGNYLLGEHVKVAEGRVNITELTEDDVDDEAVTGGYFLEIDARLDEEHWFYSPVGVPFALKSPEDITEKQLNYIKDYIADFEDVLFSETFADPENGYARYIDTESLIKWYWVNEVLKNNDAIFYSSVYVYKERNQKLKFGPLWDFDISAGNIDYNGNDDPTGWWVRGAAWISRLIEDPAFREQLYGYWHAHRAALEATIFGTIDAHASDLSVSQQLNFMKWPILDTYVWPNAVVTGSYEGEVAYLRSWLATRLSWLDENVDPAPIVLSAEEPKRNQVSVYPNPGEVRFDVELPQSAGVDNIVIRDLRGRQMVALPVATGEATASIDGAQLAPGLYLVIIRNGERTVATGKLMKK